MGAPPATSGSRCRDVMQNVFEAVHRSLAQYRPESSVPFAAWLWTITLNKTRDLIRTRRRRPETPGGEAMQQRLLVCQMHWKPT